MTYRTGIGFDIHRLEKGPELILGGYRIPFSKGLSGHSDGDCLIHAAIDAVLGALNAGDIGTHFPDTDPAFHNIASGILLQAVNKIRNEHGADLINLDAVVIAEKPRLRDYLPEMKIKLADLLEVDSEKISIKAKTHEGLGSLGRQEGIAAWVSVLLKINA
ncbi:MAG: 2-C-methyl-D-erythritol 2,4-cyclodiphosphate synthase [Candidatus Aminicenantes bacterium]